jgi:maleylacetoacetate isomerase/maleylpyruvate isomerase
LAGAARVKLYTYASSSAAYRVRIALNLKGLAPEPVFVHLLKDGGEQLKSPYAAVNPQKLVPALATDEGVLAQSLAIIEYLDETHPKPALLPATAFGRAVVRSMALAIACDIHPVNNLRVRKYLKGVLGQTDQAVDTWYRHWIELGFAGLEAQVGPHAGKFCYGDAPTLADICLVPQLYNARRFKVDLAPFPTLVAIDARAQALPAFAAAAPERQADFEAPRTH